MCKQGATENIYCGGSLAVAPMGFQNKSLRGSLSIKIKLLVAREKRLRMESHSKGIRRRFSCTILEMKWGLKLEFWMSRISTQN